MRRISAAQDKVNVLSFLKKSLMSFDLCLGLGIPDLFLSLEYDER